MSERSIIIQKGASESTVRCNSRAILLTMNSPVLLRTNLKLYSTSICIHTVQNFWEVTKLKLVRFYKAAVLLRGISSPNTKQHNDQRAAFLTSLLHRLQ